MQEHPPPGTRRSPVTGVVAGVSRRAAAACCLRAAKSWWAEPCASCAPTPWAGSWPAGR